MYLDEKKLDEKNYETRARCTIVAKGNYFLSSTYKYHIKRIKCRVINIE